jgi:hypothetical protein
MRPVFIIGAGFNVDAAEEAGVSDYRYPLVSDLVYDCFGLTSLPTGESIEDLFATAIREKRHEPLQRLCDRLMQADHYITPGLRPDRGATENSYSAFVKHFAPETVITFNYDSLLDLVLFGMQRWRPEDGYGVPVQAELHRYLVAPPNLPSKSLTIVLHQHGSLCLYPSEYRIRPDPNGRMNWIEFKDEADFIFDPDSITHSFWPFGRTLPTTGYDPVEGRIIAPVPDKAEGRKGVFAMAMARKAVETIRAAEQIVVIGYRFNPLDDVSYRPLLGAAKGRRVVLVQPDAAPLRARLEKEYASVDWRDVPLTFGEWGRRGFPLPR